MRHPLRAWRQENELTQSDVAERVGIVVSTISALENWGACSPNLARKISDFTNGAVPKEVLTFPEDYIDAENAA